MLLACRGLTKSFGATRALRGVDLELGAGAYALVGGNGAGKSTLLRVLGTLMRPDAGELVIDGLDARKEALKARTKLGYVGHESMLDPVLTLRENLLFFGRLYGVGDAHARADELIQCFAAATFADTPVADLSRGQEQAAALCRALMHKPAVLLLDEPSTGLDTAAQQRLAELIRQQANQGACVLFSTHDATLAPVAQRTLNMVDGRLT